jgi:uncharacterized repeat protein (TIGR01451 family)
MKNIFNKITSKLKKVSKFKKVLLLSLLALAIAPATYAVWGPQRPAFDWNTPEGKKGSLNGPVFNSFKNSYLYNDEFNFTSARKITDNAYSNDLKVQNGDEVEFKVFIHNNANQSTNASGLGVATGTYAGIDIPLDQYFTKNEPIGFVGASNAKPTEVFDGTLLSSANGEKFKLDYIEGSAKLSILGGGKVLPLSDNFVSKNGTPVGSEEINGIWKGCFEYVGWVNVRVKVIGEPKEEKPAVQIEKNVSTEKIGVNQEFKYTLDVKNTGNVDLNNVEVDDPAPANISFVRTEPTQGVDFTFSASRVQATIAKLKVGETKRLTIVAKVTKYAPNQIINTACVDAPEVPGEKDDCDDAPITPVEFCPIPGKETLPVGSPECNIPQTTPSTGSGTLITLASTLSIAGATYALARKFAKN